MWFGMLPVIVCDRCGLRGIPLAFASCPRCNARYGWALIDRAFLTVLQVALWDDRRRMLKRMVQRAHDDLTARSRMRAAGGLTVTIGGPVDIDAAAQRVHEQRRIAQIPALARYGLY